MVQGQGVQALCNADRQPEHLLVEYTKGQKRCFCTREIPVIKRRVQDVPVSQHLICPICNEDLRRWEKFWKRQEERDGERKKEAGRNGQEAS